MPILVMWWALSLGKGSVEGHGDQGQACCSFGHARQSWGMRPSVRRVWFLVVPRVGLLNFGGPWDVFGHANEVLGRTAYKLELVGPDTPSLLTRHGLMVGGLRPLPGAGGKTGGPFPDIAIVPGGSALEPPADRGAGVVAWLRRFHERIPTVVSVCTG